VSAPWERPPLAPPPPPCAPSALGVDLMAAARLSRALRRAPRLFERLCAPEERWEWTAPEGAGLAWACALWCAKEAAVKALRTGFWREGVDWPMVAVGAEAARHLRAPPDDPRAVWAAWAPWRRAELRAEAARRWGDSPLWCCALERDGEVWGWGALRDPQGDPSTLPSARRAQGEAAPRATLRAPRP